MLRKVNLLLVVILLLSLLAITPARAETTAPLGSCPQGFTLMTVMQHDSMEHTHIGLATDLNGDGYLCMRQATPDLHVHVDDTLPLP